VKTVEAEPILEAVRSADVGRVSAHLDAKPCSLVVLRRLVHHHDPLLRHLGLAHLAGRITAEQTGEGPEPREFAALLPASLDGPPETALVLAGLYQRLGPYTGKRAWPQWRTAGLPVRARIAWLSAELLNRPEVIRQESPGELLYQAVHALSLTDAHKPGDLVRELFHRDDPVLQTAALRLAREGLHTALLAPALVRECLTVLVGKGNADVTAAALRELAEPWALLNPFPLGRLSAFLTADAVTTAPSVADAALMTAAGHGHSGLLRKAAADKNLPPGIRRRALEQLGELAEREDIGELIEIAAEDPLLLGGPVIACLRAMHRRGRFPDGTNASAIVGLALTDHSISSREIATILFTCRHETFEALVDAGADDPAWPRRLALLTSLDGQGAGELPLGDTLIVLLPAASATGPFLRAIRALRHTAAEEAVLAVLPRSPAAALDALEAIGGPRTVAVLREGLGLAAPEDPDPDATVIAAHLRPVRDRALELLWQLTDDPEQRHALLVRLDPHDLPGRIASDLGGPNESELAVLSSHLEPGKPAEALCRLAANGGARTVPVIEDLLMRIVADLAVTWSPGSPVGRSGHEAFGEPVVPAEVVAAIHALGGRLHGRGKIRPVSLLDTTNAQDAGHALVAGMALDLLDRPRLSDGEQAILLELLLRAPYPGTRPRVHRLLRHHDKHVRKHTIALLTRDGAEALSASLISLTAAGDVQTVRQALLALGHVRARWASPAIAACLDHPNMNVKKTAAAALVRAGTPTAVPGMLFWLGHHDNPGLRDTLVEGLRAILGDAFAATLLAAAEQSRTGRTRDLLLTGLRGALSARAVGILSDQESPAAPALLTLVAAGRVGLGSGTIEELTVHLAAHGITLHTRQRSTTSAGPDAEVDLLGTEGWNLEIAVRVVERKERLRPDQVTLLRPMLADWLHLADIRPELRDSVLRFTMCLCPGPWSDAEIGIFGHSAQILLAGLTDAAGEHRDHLIAVLEAIAPALPAAEGLGAVIALRALLPMPAGRRSPLSLLRRCGAVLTRDDIEQALASARLGPSPWRAENQVLREAFTVLESPPPAEDAPWRAALAEAVRTPDALEEFRGRDHVNVGSRERLHALIGVFPSAGAPGIRDALLDWMLTLQPIDAPPWTITESTGLSGPTPRTVYDDDLDQPRSAALRDRLFAMLDSSDESRRQTAALALRDWPDPDVRLVVLRAFLRGRADPPLTDTLAQSLTGIGEAELRADQTDDSADAVHERAARLASYLAPADLERLVPSLLLWWEQGRPATRAAAEKALRRVPADALAEVLRGRLKAAAWGFLDLLSGRPLLRTPPLEETCRRLRAEARDDIAEKLTLVDGPLRRPEAARQDSATLSVLRTLPEHPAAASPRLPRRGLLDLARTGEPEQIRRALSQLAELLGRPAETSDPELRDVIGELLRHPKARVRLHAHRISRKVLDRPTYLRHTEMLLDDPQPDVVRSAIRTLCHASWEPAIPAVVSLLTHPHPAVRKAATEGLTRQGRSAIPALRYAADHARPDRRHHYTTTLEQINAANSDLADPR
jgi:HEAT repeat protein